MSYRGDVGGPVGAGAVDGAGVLHRRDPPGSRPIMPGAARGSSAVPPVEGLPVGDGQQVGAELGNLAQQRGLGGGGQAQDGHDRRDPDRDAQCRQPGAQLAGPQPDAGQPGQVGGGRSWAAARAVGRREVVVMTVLPVRASRARPRPSGQGTGTGRRSSDDVPVEHLDATPHPGGDRVVVGDHDDRGPGGVVAPPAGRGWTCRRRSRGCRWARRPVPPAGQLAIARAIATRCRSPPDSWVGRAPISCPSLTWPARRPRAAGAGHGGPRRTAARLPRCRARSDARPGRTAGI